MNVKELRAALKDVWLPFPIPVNASKAKLEAMWISHQNDLACQEKADDESRVD